MSKGMNDMAAKNIVKGMLNTFCGVWDKKIYDQIIEVYFHSLKPYDDYTVQQAGYKCMDKCQFFPKPIDIISNIHTQREEKNYEQKFEVYHGYCQVCGKSGVITIKDDETDGNWKCRGCYTGLTDIQIKERFDKFNEAFQKMKKKMIMPRNRKSLGFDPQGVPVMSNIQEMDRKMELLGQYEKILGIGKEMP